MTDYICTRCGNELFEMEQDNIKVCCDCGYSDLIAQEEFYNEESNNS